MALTGTKALIVWCQQVTHGYKDVEIRNMTSSWRDGLAFCAILHHYRPDLVNFDKLSKENIAENNHLAFTVAEQELGIPALLDVEDMVELTVPDKLSIITYVSQYYQYFRDKVPGEIPKRHASKRHSPYTMEDLPKKKVTPGIVAAKEVIGATPNPAVGKGTVDRLCANCGKTVYLMERLQIEGRLFHRVCFTCAECSLQLRAGTYRYIPIEDKFYCDKHYRQRTTSASSDDISKAQHDSHKNEQDALKNLLESLENKRKTLKQKEDENLIMKHDSVHQRIADARKRFADVSDSNTSQKPGGGSPKIIPRHPPPRPSHPPGMELASHEDSTDSNGVSSSSDAANRSVALGEVKPPSRPVNPPGQLHKDNPPSHHITDKDQARELLHGLLPKLGVLEGKELSTPQIKDDRHIYETPYLCGSVRIENEANEEEGGIFENPRYRESLKMETKPIYENHGPSLLNSYDRTSGEGLKESSEGEAMEEEDNSDGEPESDMKPHKHKKLILKAKKKRSKIYRKSRGLINAEAGSEAECDFSCNDKGDGQLDMSNSSHGTEVELRDEEKFEKDADDDGAKEIESEKEQEATLESLEGDGKEAAVDARNKENEIYENEGTISVVKDEVESADLKGKGVEETAPGAENLENEKQTENESEGDTGEDRNEIVGDMNVELQGKEIEISVSKTEIESKYDGSHENIMDIDQEEARDETDKNLKNSQVEGTPNDSHPTNGDQKVKKVLKYINPFADSDDEVLEDNEEKTKDEVPLNPFEVDSDNENFEGRQKEFNDDSKDEGIGRAVSRKTKLVPGEGPKTELSAEELVEHQKKVEIIKKGMMNNEKGETKYGNPFEDSDDDLLDHDDNKCHEGSGAKTTVEHHKKLVLKVKKKRRAPRPPEEKKPAPVESTTVQGVVANEMKSEENVIEEASSRLASADPLETFKTYIQNSEAEMRKRLDSRTSRTSFQTVSKYEQARSPTSASCPALNNTERYDELHVDETSIALDERLHDSAFEVVQTADEAPVKKEKPPKRPAPPVPKGILPYKEVSGGDRGRVSSLDTKATESKGEKVMEAKNTNQKEEADVKKEIDKKPSSKAEEGEKKKEKIKKKKGQEETPKEKGKKRDKDKLNEKENKKSNMKETDNKKEKVKGKQPELEYKEKKKKKGEKNGRKDKEEHDNQSREIRDENDESVQLQRTFSIVEQEEMSLDDIAVELKEIEDKQGLLEQKGVKMEKRLRDQLHGEPEDDYMITWFDLVTEKNKLLRRENELIYMSQEIEYHGYQKKIEFEIRLLMEKDESLKTQEDRDIEEQLLQKLVSYVARRNKIVEKMEQDRVREREEDEQIQMIMHAQGLRKQKKKKLAKKTSSGSIFYS